MVTDIKQFSADEVRNALILSKELLRQMCDNQVDEQSFVAFSRAYMALGDSISAFDRVSDALYPGDKYFDFEQVHS